MVKHVEVSNEIPICKVETIFNLASGTVETELSWSDLVDEKKLTLLVDKFVAELQSCIKEEDKDEQE